jgi:cytochrome b6-f complex iron-sulfur subunit
VLRGIAAAAVTALVGCPSDVPPADAPAMSMTSMCGPDLCLDLNDPLNAALTIVDGALTINAPSDRIVAVRTSPTAVQAVSDICTHARCSVGYDRAAKILVCPCHGSRFALTGAVLRGPAPRPLKKYETQLDAGTNLLTIVL